MISLLTFEPPRAVRADDNAVSRILDFAEFHHWKPEANGNRVAVFRLRKTIAGLPAGELVTLRSLHEMLKLT
jgi:hypothetical protein